MTALRPAPSAAPAQWLIDADVAWWDLVRFGPDGFAVYLRIPFDGDAHGDDHEPMRVALAVLASWTTTPDDAYAAVWEGWCGGRWPAPDAPLVPILNRTMLLLAGPVAELRDAPSVAWTGSPVGSQEPHLVWPADRAWCLACEVDEEIEFTVGCSADVAAALEAALGEGVRRVEYGAPAPMYRD